jgi:hypothetical protein
VGFTAGLVHATFDSGDPTNGTKVTGGIHYAVNGKLSVGVTASKVWDNTFDGGVLDDSRVGGGISYAVLPQLLVAVDYVHLLADDQFYEKQYQVGGGAEYVIFGGHNDRIFIRGGACQCNPYVDGTSATVGFGYATHSRFQIDGSYATEIQELTVSAVFRY